MRIAGRTIKIGSMTFEVKRRIMCDYGLFELVKQRISIGTKVTKRDLMRLTLIHECVHGILETNGFMEESDNEPLVECIAHGIINLLRDNPWIAELITE